MLWYPLPIQNDFYEDSIATAEWFQLCAPNTKVRIEKLDKGRLRVSTASQDMGQGTRTSLLSLLGKHLGIEP